MQTTQLDLRGIHVPETISWWPPAPGWWLLGVGILALIVFLYWIYQGLTRKTAVKTAKTLLVAIKNNRELDNKQKLGELSMLLRRVSISISPRSDVASLTGSAWLCFLDGPLKASPFSKGIGVHLADAPYRQQMPLSDAEITQLIKLCEDWLKHCTQPVRSQPTKLKKPS
ncbi:MAG: DUF4381 domain-containing protein [Methylovulum sp.]|uniref:DUF4381 domain-containing protein n=1 Tax=Methylovulum sp. TaxID=1916980 RepID=UPI002607BC5C|nr:DUF4381 domain-containing protein [Methylovulum sp.]MDD2724800.1 DUF4381 domain-containing protein [Methylovulum sp.]MDD5126114.1 DUF4381 domain-containing protein [Methylovulum sp.]